MDRRTASSEAIAELTLQGVSVSFPIYHLGSQSLKKQLLFHGSGGKLARDANDRITVEALRDITLRFLPGDRVALIGRNGAGKTTLLRVMAGIYEPDKGIVRTRGFISPMFDIGLGIDAETTGYDNIRLRGLILGLTKREIEEKMPEIVEFSELGDYLDIPVRAYSSGMRTRLTFAVATCFAPEILLMDEWIMAGDGTFMEKARLRAKSFIENASILVLATQNLTACREWCNKGVWLERGEIKAYGEIEDVLTAYEEENGLKKEKLIAQ